MSALAHDLSERSRLRIDHGSWTVSVGHLWRPQSTLADSSGLSQVLNSEVLGLFDSRSGLPRIRFHDFRHSHVTLLIAAGEQPLLIVRRLGHATASLTLDRYGHLFGQVGSQAANRSPR